MSFLPVGSLRVEVNLDQLGLFSSSARNTIVIEDAENVDTAGSWMGGNGGLVKDLKSLTKREKLVLDNVLWAKDLNNDLFSVTKTMKDQKIIK